MRKYRNTPIVIDNIRFDSKAEAKRYGELKLLERSGEISNLILQPRYPLYCNGVKVCTYVADFEYISADAATTEDVKGVKTPVYRLKAKMFAAEYGYEVTEIGVR